MQLLIPAVIAVNPIKTEPSGKRYWCGTARAAYYWFIIYRQTSNISRTLVGSKIVDHVGVVEASPDGAAPTTSSLWI